MTVEPGEDRPDWSPAAVEAVVRQRAADEDWASRYDEEPSLTPVGALGEVRWRSVRELRADGVRQLRIEALAAVVAGVLVGAVGLSQDTVFSALWTATVCTVAVFGFTAARTLRRVRWVLRAARGPASAARSYVVVAAGELMLVYDDRRSRPVRMIDLYPARFGAVPVAGSVRLHTDPGAPGWAVPVVDGRVVWPNRPIEDVDERLLLALVYDDDDESLN
jgi:hypothetical protein